MHKTPFLSLVEQINREQRLVEQWVSTCFGNADVTAARLYGVSAIDVYFNGEIVASATIDEIEHMQRLQGFEV